MGNIAGLMQRLERMISEQLEKRGLCPVPDEELRRVWPDDIERRYQVARFAQAHGWMLLSYTDDKGAIFAPAKSLK